MVMESNVMVENEKDVIKARRVILAMPKRPLKKSPGMENRRKKNSKQP